MDSSRRTFMDNLSLAANFPTGRRDHSRSPPKQGFHDDPRGRDSRHRDEAGMRYDREHDRRKGRSAWGGASRGQRHNPREDHDYRGMYDDGHAGDGDQGRDRYDDERYRGRRTRYRDDDGLRSRSRSGSYRGRSRSHSSTREAGKPSDTVILEGLPFSLSSTELRDSLLTNSIAAEFPSIDVRLSSSKGNFRAFVQFPGVDYAVAFMREHYPKLLVELTNSTDDVPEGRFDAYIHYARSRDARDEPDTRGGPGSNWLCPTCDFSNYSTRSKCKICGGPQGAPIWQQSLTGMADVADVPSQILVVYPLASFVNEGMLADDMRGLELVKVDNTKDNSNGAPKLKSTAPIGDTTGIGARPGSLHRVFLMRDTSTHESFKYGFAEFWTMEDAAAAMAKFRKSRSFTIGACPVTVSCTHMGVFVPEDREVTPAIEQMSFHPLFNPSLRVRYRDLHAYPSQLVLTMQPPGNEEASKGPPDEANDKKTKKRKADASLPASSAKKMVPMAGQMAVWQRKRDELRDDETGGESKKPELSDVNRTPLRIAMSGNGADGPKPQPAIKISISGATKLGGPEPVVSDKPGPAADLAATSGNARPLAVAPDEAPVSYVDRDRLMCLICMRKYKSVDEVNIHEKSRNHKNATENEEQERREAYSQPTKPAPAPAPQGKPKPAPAKPDEAAQPAKPAASSKGAGMLAKMGWSAGAGLGANADGRTDVIVTNAYQEGVGLGADGGNLGDAAALAERKTKNSYAEYLNTVQDKARERYNKMG
ncbi:hypothetical protein ACJZ2D_002738 [Fusarium nematophilum]